jgi:mannitol-1-phosphate 5-dehydrogenase
MLKKPIVIIGAGKTGRGFLARLAFLSGFPIIFVDKDVSLVNRLNVRGEYNISFFGNRRAPLKISSFSAHIANSDYAEELIAKSELVFTCVGASNLEQISVLIAESLKKRIEHISTKTLYIVTAENAISPAKKLSDMIQDRLGSFEHDSDQFLVAEAAIFCTTIEDTDDPLNIRSEDLDILPYDASQIGETLNILCGAQAEYDFNKVLQRKIYTYNCASACIAYLGFLRKYTCFAEAANDPVIVSFLQRLYLETGEAICREYGFSETQQEEFALRSLRKFQDYEIRDSVERNARDVVRKLLPDERLVGPAILMQKHGLVPTVLPIVYAAALLYRHSGEEELLSLLASDGVSGILEKISRISPESDFGEKVLNCYSVFKEALKTGADPLNEILKRGL